MYPLNRPDGEQERRNLKRHFERKNSSGNFLADRKRTTIRHTESTSKSENETEKFCPVVPPPPAFVSGVDFFVLTIGVAVVWLQLSTKNWLAH